MSCTPYSELGTLSWLAINRFTCSRNSAGALIWVRQDKVGGAGFHVPLGTKTKLALTHWPYLLFCGIDNREILDLHILEKNKNAERNAIRGHPIHGETNELPRSNDTPT